jgi:hypothetical protein
MLGRTQVCISSARLHRQGKRGEQIGNLKQKARQNAGL